MSNRLSLDPDNRFAVTLKGIVNDIEQLKHQQAFGSDSLRPQILDSGKVYDYDSVQDLLNSPFFYNVAFTVTFTADHQINPYAQPFATVTNPDGSPTPWAGFDLYNVTQLTKWNGVSSQFFVDDHMTSQQLLVRRTTPFRLKWYMQASDTGHLAFDVSFGTPAP